MVLTVPEALTMVAVQVRGNPPPSPSMAPTAIRS